MRSISLSYKNSDQNECRFNLDYNSFHANKRPNPFLTDFVAILWIKAAAGSEQDLCIANAFHKHWQLNAESVRFAIFNGFQFDGRGVNVFPGVQMFAFLLQNSVVMLDWLGKQGVSRCCWQQWCGRLFVVTVVEEQNASAVIRCKANKTNKFLISFVPFEMNIPSLWPDLYLTYFTSIGCWSTAFTTGLYWNSPTYTSIWPSVIFAFDLVKI